MLLTTMLHAFPERAHTPILTFTTAAGQPQDWKRKRRVKVVVCNTSCPRQPDKRGDLQMKKRDFPRWKMRLVGEMETALLPSPPLLRFLCLLENNNNT